MHIGSETSVVFTIFSSILAFLYLCSCMFVLVYNLMWKICINLEFAPRVVLSTCFSPTFKISGWDLVTAKAIGYDSIFILLYDELIDFTNSQLATLSDKDCSFGWNKPLKRHVIHLARWQCCQKPRILELWSWNCSLRFCRNLILILFS